MHFVQLKLLRQGWATKRTEIILFHGDRFLFACLLWPSRVFGRLFMSTFLGRFWPHTLSFVFRGDVIPRNIPDSHAANPLYFITVIGIYLAVDRDTNCYRTSRGRRNAATNHTKRRKKKHLFSNMDRISGHL